MIAKYKVDFDFNCNIWFNKKLDIYDSYLTLIWIEIVFLIKVYFIIKDYPIKIFE